MTLSNLNSSPHPFNLTFCLRVGVGLETAPIEFTAVFPLTITEGQADTLSEMIVASDPCLHTGEREQGIWPARLSSSGDFQKGALSLQGGGACSSGAFSNVWRNWFSQLAALLAYGF